MTRFLGFWLVGFLCLMISDTATAESTLAKIDKSGTLTIGTRRGSPLPGNRRR